MFLTFSPEVSKPSLLLASELIVLLYSRICRKKQMWTKEGSYPMLWMIFFPTDVLFKIARVAIRSTCRRFFKWLYIQQLVKHFQIANKVIDFSHFLLWVSKLLGICMPQWRRALIFHTLFLWSPRNCFLPHIFTHVRLYTVF